jgi:amidase
MRLWRESICAEIRLGLLPVMKSIGGRDALRFLEDFLAQTPDGGLDGYMRALADRNALAREWAQFQGRYPVVLGPVRTEPPFVVGRDLAGRDSIDALVRSMRLVVTVNLLGLPAVALPVGVAHGLPQGVQLVGARFREDHCLAAGEAIESQLGPLTPIDPR